MFLFEFKRLFLSTYVFFCFNIVFANNLYVPDEWTTIQEAIDAANNGDVVIVSPGTYYENIDFLGKNIPVRSEDPDDPSIVENTVIDAGGNGSVVTFANGEGRDSVLQGFTITGGHNTTTRGGGGVSCLDGSPTISQNIIVNNVSLYNAGGLNIHEGNPLVCRNVIISNSANSGGGVYSISPAEFCNNVICNNTASKGGGLYLRDPSIVANNLVYNNVADGFEGGGVYLRGASDSFVIGNTIVGNSSGKNGANLDIEFSDNVVVANNIITNALNSSGVYLSYSTSVIFAYNNVWNNATGNYDGLDDPTDKNGNISTDPIFVSLDTDDYHLQATSPCINTGDPDFIPEPDETDIDFESRIMKGRVDIGSDEYFGNASPRADAGPDQFISSSILPMLITLDGNGSSDPDGDDLSYHWRQIDGPVVSLSNINIVPPTFVPLQHGIYVFGLIVNDGVYDSIIEDTVTITLNNIAPIADAGPDQTYGSTPSLITLDGSGSFDSDNDTIYYQWSQISGPAVELSSSNTITPTFEPLEFGIYVFELVVNDKANNSIPDTIGIVIGNNRAPVADAGYDQYVEKKWTFDGSGSYDPDYYGALTYQWTQISGPTTTIEFADTATPTITVTKSNLIQECGFELVVSDGDLLSEPDTINVKIVPDTGDGSLLLSDVPFDLNKPTIFYFGGGNGVSGGGAIWSDWDEKVNFISCMGSGPRNGYSPPYKRWGDKLIVYLSSVAPGYTQPIQTLGFSTGGKPAAVVASHINKAYSDKRYDVNRVTLLDSIASQSDVMNYLNSGLDNEQCWIDNYVCTVGSPFLYPRVLNIYYPPPGFDHCFILGNYVISLDGWFEHDIYNSGLSRGSFWSVAGPGKNLQLANSGTCYYFKWSRQEGGLVLYNKSSYPGKLPEPVTLIGPDNGSVVGNDVVDSNEVILSCEKSQNAISYQLLISQNPYPVTDYTIISDSPEPPNEAITVFPSRQTWWTVKAYDQWGSTIYADPISFTINTKPVADAGPDKTVVVNSNVSLCGGASSDPDGDSLSCHWELVSVPAGSMVELSDPNIVAPSFVPDLPGDYVASLTVNDSFIDSEPDDVTVTVLSPRDAAVLSLGNVVEIISNLEPDSLQNKNMRTALLNKIEAILKMIEAENYKGSLAKLENDILSKIDGCTNNGEPNKNDWIITCDEQKTIYSSVLKTIEHISNAY